MNSDTLDLIASYFLKKAQIQQDLSLLTCNKVDLVMLGAPLKSITKQLNHDKILIYENLSPKLERANLTLLKWM